MRILFLICSLCCAVFIIPILGQKSPLPADIQTLITTSRDNMKKRSFADSLVNLAYNKAIAINDYQGQVDALDLKADLFDAYDDLDSSMYYYEKGLELAVKKIDKKTESFFHYSISLIQSQLGDLSGAIASSKKGIAISEAIQDTVALGTNFRNQAILYNKSGDLENALLYYLEGIKYVKKEEDSYLYGRYLQGIGIVYNKQHDFKKAKEYFTEVMEIAVAEKDTLSIGVTLNDLGIMNKNQGNLTVAEENYLKMLAIADQSPNYSYFIPVAYVNLGVLYLKMQQYEKGIEYNLKAHNLLQSTNDIQAKSDCLNHLAKCQLALKQIDNAYKNATEALSLARKTESLEKERNALLTLSEIYEQKGQAAKALSYFKQHKMLYDSIYNLEKSEKIHQLETKYATAKKEQEIASQKNQIATLKNEAAISQLQKWLLGIGLGLSCVILGLAYFGFKQKIERNQLQKEQQKVLYENELAFKKRELTTHALHLAKKNEVLSNLKQKAISLNAIEKESKGYQKLINTIDFDLRDEDNWENFRIYFEQIHANFNTKVLNKYPKMTSTDLRLMALLKMNLSSKEIANILNISAAGIKKARQRLRKKLDLVTSDSLEGVIMGI